MGNFFKIVVWGLLLVVFLACGQEESPDPHQVTLTFAFEQDEEGWQGGFSDLPEPIPEFFELDYGHGPLPPETLREENALFIQGHNRSDDLFMYFKRELTDLRTNTTYQLTFDVELASQYPESSFGIGGSPGSSVFLKGGAVPFEPRAEAGEDGYLQMNLDKGNQAEDGAHMYHLGHIGIGGDDFNYTLINRGNADRPLMVSTDGDGLLWLIVGTDSGFEGLTRLYYNRITVELREVR